MNEVIELLLAASALGGVVVAYIGVDAWKRQLYGTDKYHVGVRAKKALLTYRESIRRVREAFLAIAEWPAPSSEKEQTMTGEEKFYFGLTGILDTRLKELSAARVDLEHSLIEVETYAEAVLPITSEKVLKLSETIRVSAAKLSMSYNPVILERDRKYIIRGFEEYREVLIPDDAKGDAFAQQCDEAVANLVREIKYRCE